MNVVLELTLKDELIINRMSGRRVHQPSGRSYHLEFNPPEKDGFVDKYNNKAEDDDLS